MPPDSPAPETASATAVPRKPRRRRAPEERIAELDGRIRQLRAKAARERRRADTARLLKLGRMARTALGDAADDDLARLILLGRWAVPIAASDAGAQRLDAWARSASDREILGLAPLPGGTPASASH